MDGAGHSVQGDRPIELAAIIAERLSPARVSTPPSQRSTRSGEHRQGHRARSRARCRGTRGRRTAPQPLGGIGSQPLELELTDLVGQCLCGHGQVAVDLGCDLVDRDRGVLGEVVERLLSRPSEGVQTRVDDQACGTPGVCGEHADAVERRGVQAHLVRQPFRVQPPPLDVGRRPVVSLELREIPELLADGDLQMVARDGLVERDRLGLGARGPGGICGVDEVGACPGAVGRRREVVRVGGIGRQVESGMGSTVHATPGSRPNQPGIVSVARSTLRRASSTTSAASRWRSCRVGPQPIEDGCEVLGADRIGADRRELQRQVDLAELAAELVQLAGGWSRVVCCATVRRRGRRRRAASTSLHVHRRGHSARAHRSTRCGTSRTRGGCGHVPAGRLGRASAALDASSSVHRRAVGQRGRDRSRSGRPGRRRGCAGCVR